MARRLSLFKDYDFDINYEYVKGFATQQDQFNYFESLPKFQILDGNYHRTGQGQIKIASDTYGTYETFYDFLVGEGYNYMWLNNGDKYYYCFITSKEMVSENTCVINFAYDVWQTFMFDFDIDSSFVKRYNCSLSDIANYDEGLEIGEHVIESSTQVFDKDIEYFYVLNGFRTKEIIYDQLDPTIPVSSFDTDYGAETPKCQIQGIDYPLNFIRVSDPVDNGAPAGTVRDLLSSHPSLLGIIGLPTNNTVSINTETVNVPFLVRNSSTGVYETRTYDVKFTTFIDAGNNFQGTPVNISKSSFTDFYPYTYYVVTDAETNPFIIKPQYLSGTTIQISEDFALSYNPVVRYGIANYKGNDIRTFNMKNNAQLFLPSGTNEGQQYLIANSSSIETQKTLNWTNAGINVLKGVGAGVFAGATGGGAIGSLFGGIGAVPGAIVGGIAGAVGGAISGINSISSENARLEDIQLTPDSIVSFGQPSTRGAFSESNVRVQKWTIEQKYKDKINAFVGRYGYQFNNYTVIDHKTYKGFVQMVSPRISSGIDTQFRQAIINILERGVYIE